MFVGCNYWVILFKSMSICYIYWEIYFFPFTVKSERFDILIYFQDYLYFLIIAFEFTEASSCFLIQTFCMAFGTHFVNIIISLMISLCYQSLFLCECISDASILSLDLNTIVIVNKNLNYCLNVYICFNVFQYGFIFLR